ncbi:MAG: phosphoribosylanthranilate isomerase [Candidatus Eisenbacteria bacterium]|uniref:N-(5'-phosphoribosyl)anthranilate isomerase n=1 Tax=Eiseniibacteriota bacterium TaxID=2212470 RepID=A0A538T2T3_UNCEI|nr:MAG: phosphoribosylanthranilate isomerase [Candidatus Eisenbacteria bacterium]
MRTRIKVCGVTTPQDAAMAARAGADYIGVVLTESARRVTAARAREIAFALPAATLLVAVFADEGPKEVARAIEGLPVHAVQVRGWDDAAPAGAYEIWHVLRGASLPEPAALPMVPLRTYLLDAQDPVLPGGTGKRADWDWARRGVNSGLRLIVAGGLRSESVSELVLEVRPFGVDASSGLESEPGRKDPAKVQAFVERVRQADRIRPKRS